MASHQDGHAIFAAVLDKPEDPLLRLIYADWLEEQGRLEAAAFVRETADKIPASIAGDWYTHPRFSLVPPTEGCIWILWGWFLDAPSRIIPPSNASARVLAAIIVKLTGDVPTPEEFLEDMDKWYTTRRDAMTAIFRAGDAVSVSACV